MKYYHVIQRLPDTDKSRLRNGNKDFLIEKFNLSQDAVDLSIDLFKKDGWITYPRVDLYEKNLFCKVYGWASRENKKDGDFVFKYNKSGNI